MLSIDKKYKKSLEFLKKEIARRQRHEEEVFLDWCIELNIDPDGEQGMILFSYLFNGEKIRFEYKK